jgi:hypothetical protein
VLLWAADDKLQAHSENDVVYLLSEWVEAQKRGGRPCSPEELTQLVHMVRLADCGPAYLQFVLPALDWFKSGHKSLSKCSILRGLEDAGITCTSEMRHAPRTRIRECDVVDEWHICAKQLVTSLQEQELHGTRTHASGVFLNGFWMSAHLRLQLQPAPQPQLQLGCFVWVDRAKMCRVVPWPDHAAVAFSCSIAVGKARKSPCVFILTCSRSRGYSDMLASSPSVAALLAPHLEGGQLKCKATFSYVDMLGCDMG